MPIVYRFLRDLRLDDHAGLAEASKHGEIVPALILDQPLKKSLQSSPRRAAFFCGAVSALDARLRELGSRLIVRRGESSVALREIARECGARHVAWSVSYDGAARHEQHRTADDLQDGRLRVLQVHDAPAIPAVQTTAARSTAGDGYRAFGPYFEVWKQCEPAVFEAPLLLRFWSKALQTEQTPDAREFQALENDCIATPTQALNQLARFLDGCATQYSVGAHVPSEDGTSRLSAHLSFGTISARSVVRAVSERSRDAFLLSEERLSLKRFLRALSRRDFFLQLRWYHPHTDCMPLQERMRHFDFALNHPALEAWLQGRTGFPLIDAGIRQLHASGWMHPLVRSIAASFLCFDLGVDWKIGRDEWDRYLTEDDEALASGNWQWVAGVGADRAAYPRIYNPEGQAHRLDPAGEYARRWISELEMDFATARRSNTGMQIPLFQTRAYAAPVVVHRQAAREFLDRYGAYIKQEDVRPTSR